MYTKFFSAKILFLLCVGILVAVYVISVYAAGSGGAYAYAAAYNNMAYGNSNAYLNVTNSQETGDFWTAIGSLTVNYIEPYEYITMLFSGKDVQVSEIKVYWFEDDYAYYFDPVRSYRAYSETNADYSKISPYHWEDSDSDYYYK